jgi:hypothetical protein
MGIADRIYELVKGLPEPEACKILRFAESLRGRSVTVVPAQRQVDLAVFRQYRGRYDGRKIDRAELYDRAGLR